MFTTRDVRDLLRYIEREPQPVKRRRRRRRPALAPAPVANVQPFVAPRVELELETVWDGGEGLSGYSRRGSV